MATPVYIITKPIVSLDKVFLHPVDRHDCHGDSAERAAGYERQ
jgi:hypothetical protein